MRGVEDKRLLKEKGPAVWRGDWGLRIILLAQKTEASPYALVVSTWALPTTRHAGTTGMKIPQMSLSQLHPRDDEFSGH